MDATFIPGAEINSDLGVVNAARVSFNKQSELERYHVINGCKDEICCTQGHYSYRLKEGDKKLIQYLAKNNHWTPFAHSRLYFQIRWSDITALQFYRNVNRAGMVWLHTVEGDFIKGSLYSWYNACATMPERYMEAIHEEMFTKFPVSYRALVKADPTPFHWQDIISVSEDWLIQNRYWGLATATLHVKVPIFVARQIRTSQVGIAYSDLYVEGESFVFNEVSRRYVNDEPEFYKIEQWRAREGKSIKQGSTGDLEYASNSYAKIFQDTAEDYCKDYYNDLLNMKAAPEQARALLPQSMYTEFYMTATLHRWAQFIALRSKKDVQRETRDITWIIACTLGQQFPQWEFEYDIYRMFS